MAESIKIHTTGIMEKTSVTAVTSEATNHPIEMAFDFNPDTYWKPSSTANQTIDIDMGEVVTVDLVGIFIHDFNTAYASPVTFAVYTDDNDDGNYTTTTAFSGSVLANTQGEPIYFPNSTPTQTSKRYWRIEIQNLTDTIEISQFLLLRTRDIGQANELPETDSIGFINDTQKAEGGRLFKRRVNRNSTERIPRKFKIHSVSGWESEPLYLAHQDCAGDAFPAVLEEDGVFKLVYFSDGDLKKNKISYKFYEPTVVFETLPYSEDGEGY